MAYTIAANPAYNDIEITFDGKPSKAVREALKSLRFRWHKIKKVWYGYTDENTARAAIDAAEQNSDGAASAAAATTEQTAEKKPLPFRDPAALEQYRAVLERVYPGDKKMNDFLRE